MDRLFEESTHLVRRQDHHLRASFPVHRSAVNLRRREGWTGRSKRAGAPCSVAERSSAPNAELRLGEGPQSGDGPLAGVAVLQPPELQVGEEHQQRNHDSE
jgi:hypothetical protein